MCQADRTEGNVINVVRCNVGRASFDNAADIIDDLLAVQQGLYCIQEVASWPGNFELECFNSKLQLDGFLSKKY